MKNFVDWNSRLMPCMRGYITEPSACLQVMQELSLRFGFDSFAMTADFDCSAESVSIFLLRFQRSQSLLKPLLSKRIQVKFFAQAWLSPGLSQTKDLEKLLFSKQNLLPIRFPISVYEDWMDLEINHLLYKKKFGLLFTSFEMAILMFPEEIIEKLLRISRAVFQFNYKALTDPKSLRVIKKLIAQRRPILFGSALDSLQKVYFYEFDYYLESAKAMLSKEEYHFLIANNRLFWNR